MNWLEFTGTVAISTVISTPVAALLAYQFALRQSKRVWKYDCFRRLMANRYDTTCTEFCRAINEVHIVYHDKKSIRTKIEEIKNINREARPADVRQRAYVELFKAIAKDLAIDFSDFTDDALMTAFGPTNHNDAKQKLQFHVATLALDQNANAERIGEIMRNTLGYKG